MVLPLLRNNFHDKKTYKDFSCWWDQIVLDDRTHQFSRKDLVLLVADKDGGAHVDLELPTYYHNLTRDDSMGWTVCIGGIKKPLKDFCFASIRQIGFEIDETLSELRTDLWRY